MNYIAACEPQYPPLDRAAFLIDRACLLGCAPPPYCAEEAQLFAGLAAALSKSTPPKEAPDSR